MGLFLLFFVSFLLRSLCMARECAKMGICLAHLKQIGLACSQYAEDYKGVFPSDLSLLYPNYVNSLENFICPGRRPKVSEEDVLNNFTICYEYTTGLTKQDDPECLLLYDREGNHRRGYHKGDRNVVFVNGTSRGIKETNWSSVYQRHEMGLRKKKRLDSD